MPFYSSVATLLHWRCIDGYLFLANPCSFCKLNSSEPADVKVQYRKILAEIRDATVVFDYNVLRGSPENETLDSMNENFAQLLLVGEVCQLKCDIFKGLQLYSQYYR